MSRNSGRLLPLLSAVSAARGTLSRLPVRA